MQVLIQVHRKSQHSHIPLFLPSAMKKTAISILKNVD